jgi:hypothetical protein
MEWNWDWREESTVRRISFKKDFMIHTVARSSIYDESLHCLFVASINRSVWINYLFLTHSMYIDLRGYGKRLKGGIHSYRCTYKLNTI